jgi:acetyl esterase/lipase
MKKSIILALTFCALQISAQFAGQVTFKKYFTAHQVDSVLTAVTGISGVFPTNYDVKAYKVIYNTVKWDSTPTTASGLMIVPVNAPCKVPVLSYQHGTITRKSDAPSRFKSEWYLALAAASKGYVGLMPDYLGLGDGPGLHPYQHAHTEATAVIDLIRAMKEVIDTIGSPINDQLFLMGYSQGGHATMAAHQLLQEQFDSTMHVTASVPMSGAYDMSGVMADVMSSDSTYPSPYYLPYLLLGYNQIYHLFTNDSDVMVHPYDSVLPPMFNGTKTGNQIDAVMPAVPKLIMQPAQMDSFINDSINNFFRFRLRENNTYNWIPNSPVKMLYCQGDHSVPYKNSIVAYQHFIQNGATLVDTLDVNPTLDHYPCAQFAILTAVYLFDSLTFHPLQAGGITVTNDTSITPSGSATVLTQDGEPPFAFAWSNGDTTATTSNLAAGKYFVTVTDKSNCTYVDSALIAFVSGIETNVLGNVHVFPNPANGHVTVQNMNSDDNITQVQLFDISGQAVKMYSIKQGNMLQIYFDDAAKGIYYLQLKSESGKESRKKIALL